MKKILLCCLTFATFNGFAQVTENFSDGNFSENPTWVGSDNNFRVNEDFVLQSKAETASVSYLATPNSAINDATWECLVKITTTTSSMNYASLYVISDRADFSEQCNGYFVQIGNTADEICLYKQSGTTKTKIIDGADKRVDMSTVEVNIKLTRDTKGNFALYSKLASESDFVLEGTCFDDTFVQTSYFGLLFVNSNSTGSAYHFDDIFISGNPYVDSVAPKWTLLEVENDSTLWLHFSEAVDTTNATFLLDNEDEKPINIELINDCKQIKLYFKKPFTKGITHTLSVLQLTDLAGNALQNTTQTFFIPEDLQPNDLVLNEIMYYPTVDGQEYVEIYNRTSQTIDLSGIVITTRKTDGSFNTGNIFPPESFVAAGKEIALCANDSALAAYHQVPNDANIVTNKWSQALNNSGATVYLLTSDKKNIIDSVTYTPDWHHPSITNSRGISLERTNPDWPSNEASSWHSASLDNGGTPGYVNSQYVDTVAPTWLNTIMVDDKHLQLVFSEAIDTTTAIFTITAADDEIEIAHIDFLTNGAEVLLELKNRFEDGVIYTIWLENITDLAGNRLVGTAMKQFGYTEWPANEDLVINEIMFNPAADGQEYVEIANRTNKLLDVSNLIITTRKSDGSFNNGNILPQNAMLAPFGELAICANAALLIDFHQCPIMANVQSVKWNQTLNNDGAQLYLLSSDYNTVLDSVAYSAKWHHTLVKNEKGVALERIHPDLPSTNASSWHSAASETNFGTPGYRNSQYQDLQAEVGSQPFIWTATESFSPDGDGFEDVCIIHYQMPEEGFTAQIRLFTPSGMLVAKIADNALLASEGTFLWDGTTQQGKNANIGVYVLIFEAYNANTGQTMTRKFPVVVAGR